MIDWLTSKVALSVAALLLLASAGGAFELVKARNAQDRLDECAAAIARTLWELNASGEGSEVAMARGAWPYPAEVLGDPLTVRFYPGLVAVRAGGRSASARLPEMAHGGAASPPWTGESFAFRKVGGGLVVLAPGGGD